MSVQEAKKRYVALVQRLEKAARRNPTGFRTRLMLLAFLGFAFLTLVFLFSAGLLTGIVWGVIFIFKSMGHVSGSAVAGTVKLLIYIGIPLGIFALTLFFALLGTVLRLIWFRVPPPEGLELKRGAATRLFSLVDRLSSNMGTPPIHAIVIDGDFNAGVMQVPRLGLLGFHKNYLVVGLPLLQALSPEQFRAVLAHEFGHVAGSHGRFNLWVFSLQMMWGQLISSLTGDDEDQHVGINVIIGFLNWYAPLLFAHIFALRRMDEYQADNFAKRFTGEKIFAESLVAVNTRARYLAEDFWPRIEQSAKRQGNVAIFTTLGQTFQQGLPPEIQQKWLIAALQEQTDFDDTHPCLAERLKALGIIGEPPLPAYVPETAAVHYLGPTAEKLTGLLDQLFSAAMAQG